MQIVEVFPGREWLESSDGRVLLRTTLSCGSNAAMGGQLTASFNMDQILVVQDVSRVLCPLKCTAPPQPHLIPFLSASSSSVIRAKNTELFDVNCNTLFPVKH